MRDITIRRCKVVIVDEHYNVPDDGMDAKQFIDSIENMLANHEEHKYFDHTEEHAPNWDRNAVVIDNDELLFDFTYIDDDKEKTKTF